jgi:hypothetical protein
MNRRDRWLQRETQGGLEEPCSTKLSSLAVGLNLRREYEIKTDEKTAGKKELGFVLEAVAAAGRSRAQAGQRL